MTALFELLRPHQWAKNLLVFVAAVTSHRILELAVVLQLLPLFGAACLLSSAVYVLNDALDVEADRAHPDKCRRPFARGALTPRLAPLLIVLLLLGAAALAWMVAVPAQLALVAYAVLAALYCLLLKRLLWLDVLVLAALYVLRVVAGALAIGVALSPWLAAFALFLFVALAALKRYAELRTATVDVLPGRAYRRDDAAPVLAFGSASAIAALLVLALYLNSPEVLALYRQPALLWPIAAALLYWQARLWTLAHRGDLHHDPVLFALRDPASWLVGLACLACLGLAV